MYDCRAPLLPVSIQLQDLRRSSADRPTAPSSLSSAPVEATPGFSDSVREPVATLGSKEIPSDDPGTDVEDKLEDVSPLPSMISPIPGSDAESPMSPVGYLEPPLPTLVGSPTTPLVEIALTTRVQFLPYTVSPEHVLYGPAVSLIMMDLPATVFRRPEVRRQWNGYWREMWICVWIVNWTYPVCHHRYCMPCLNVFCLQSLPWFPSAGGSPDLSREGPIDVSQDSSVSGVTPRVMDNLPGFQYRI